MSEKPKPEKNLPPLAERVADKIVGMGMGVPTIFYLEMTRPMSLVNGSLLTAIEPFINGLYPVDHGEYQTLCRLIEDRSGVESFIQHIEGRLEDDQQPSPKEQSPDDERPAAD